MLCLHLQNHFGDNNQWLPILGCEEKSFNETLEDLIDRKELKEASKLVMYFLQLLPQ
jgi:hypothetical protein